MWKHKTASFWIYSGLNGMWIVGGVDAQEKKFACSHGVLFCRVLHGGAQPDRVSGVWWRLEGEDFVEDPHIKVSSQYLKPSVIQLNSPHGQVKCQGDYQLAEGETANGFPVWRHQNGRHWLYSGANGSWIFGGKDAKERNFQCSRGVIYSKGQHGGVTPDKVTSVWLRLAKDKFVEDPHIKVCMRPPPLYVQTPNGQQRVAGEYVPLQGQIANGQPIWEHTSGKCWLYTGTNGMWIIGGSDAKAKNFECTRGVIYCQTAHNGLMPDRMVGGWLRLDGEAFKDDAAISVSTKPATLHVICPTGQQKCAGEYLLVPSETSNGCPVWRQKKGHLRIRTGAAGTWIIAGPSSGPSSSSDEAGALIRCDTPHNGLMPDKVAAAWSRLDGEVYAVDGSIKILTVVPKPARLRLITPNGQTKCAGDYLLVADRTANGQPLWKQTAGKYWLYSGINGMWIIGGSGAEQKNFDCSKGVIYTKQPHGGLMPQISAGPWLRLEGDVFKEDPDIQVATD